MPALPLSRSAGSRIEGVDLLRGLAILYVLMNHVNMQMLFAHVPFTRGLPPKLVSSLVWNGQYGVQIFFAISGYLITATTLRRWKNPAAISIPGFYRMRFARIAPLFLLLLALLSALDLAGVSKFVISTKTGGLGAALFAALTFHINYLEATRGYLPGSWDILWSLSIEEAFYLFFPLLCRWLGRGRLLIALLLLLAALGPFARTVLTHGNPVWREYSYFGATDAIAFGCLTALGSQNRTFSPPLMRLATIAGLTGLVAVLCFTPSALSRILYPRGLDMTLIALSTCLLIIPAAQTNWKSPVVLRPVALLGQRSYEIYLTHMFVVITAFEIYMAIGKPVALSPLVFLAVILVAGAVGPLVAVAYSEPLNRRLRHTPAVPD